MTVAFIVFFPLLTLPLMLLPLPASLSKQGRNVTAVLAALPVLLSCGVALVHLPAVFAGVPQVAGWSWIPDLGLDLVFRLDGLSLMFDSLILVIGLLVILYARYYLKEKDSLERLFGLMSVFMTAMLGVVMSGNVIQMWVFWEMTGITSFLLISYWWHKADARKGAYMALVITGAGGLALLAGLVLLGQAAGSYDLDVILESGERVRTGRWYPWILVLVLLGAFTKSAQFPFHAWLPNAMAAPTPVSAFLHSATMVKAGVFLLARFYPVLAGTDLWFELVGLTGLVTLLAGAVMALFQHDLKGLLAYSTISHLGLIILLFGLDTELAAVAAVFHILNHATFKASLFMATGIIDHETGTRDMRKLSGLWRCMPHTAALAMTAAAAMAGVPLLNGFLSKEMFFAETLHQQVLGSLSWLVPVLATAGGVFSVAYSIRFIQDVFFGEGPSDISEKPHEPPRYMRVPVEVLVGWCLVVGIFPNVVAKDILNLASAEVLGGPVPAFKLGIWHGFNLPLLMSVMAVAGGVFIYLQRGLLFEFHRSLPEVNALKGFEEGIRTVSNWCETKVRRLENDRLQRYILILLLCVLAVAGGPLLSMTHLTGNVPAAPVDIRSALGTAILITGALATVLWHRIRVVALLMVSIAGLMTAVTFTRFSAPDLALTQLTVEVVTVILLMLALFFLPWRTPAISSAPRVLRDLGIASAVGVVTGSICYSLLTRSVPVISDYFTANAKTGAGGTNVVNVILVDFRAFDTLGEITVLGIAALGIATLLTRLPARIPLVDELGKPWAKDRYPVLLSTIAQGVLPLAFLVTVYLFFRGHNQPGGGFIAGLVTASALILQYMARGSLWVEARIRISYQKLAAAGMGLALVTGMGSWVFGRPFLTTWFAYFKLPVLGKFELATAMVFDLGVYMTVVGATMEMLTRLGNLAVGPGEKEM